MNTHESIFDQVKSRILTPARRERFAYFQAIPLPRMFLLCAAVFCLFASIGFISALRGEHALNLLRGFISATLTAALGVIYIVFSTRKPRLFPVAIAFQIAAIKAGPALIAILPFVWMASSYEEAVHIDSTMASVFSALAYTLFFFFIQTEGQNAFRTQTELALAHTIQATLVPIISLSTAGCEIYGISAPSHKVGGDLVDLVSLTDGSAVTYLADIAGHGLQAGILMGMVKAAARTSLLTEPSPQALFTNLNRVLPGVKESNMYATCAALRLTPLPGHGVQVEYSLAGHPAILHFSNTGSVKPPLSDEQLPLGILQLAEYRSQSVLVARGELLIATTDGVLEAAGKDGVEFGLEGVERVVTEDPEVTLAILAQRILAAASRFGPADDDRTLLLIKVL